MKVAQFINKALGSVSMYEGVSFGLSGVWGFAFILSFFGLVPFSPLELAASAVVLVASVTIVSMLCGKIFGVAVHAESSFITAMILALIFSPTLSVGGLLVLFFVGAIAAASKFVLVLKGRHIFNPAAIAAVIVGLTGLGVATWWVATPILTPVVLLLVLISLYRARRFGIAGVFLLTAVPILLVLFAQYGATTLESLGLLLSWPLLFFAGIMLTEPLTLPPRKWQMYIEAVFVGILFALPISFAGFEMTPALALVAGNIMAATFAGRQAITLTLKKRRALTPTTDEFIFTPNEPLHFTAGQYLEIQVPHKKKDLRGLRRSFSMTSMPGEDEVRLGIKFYEPSSTLKKTLRSLPLGTPIQATGYWGDFVPPKNPQTPVLYLAGGIGITPFISHIQATQNYADVRDVVLIYSVANAEEIAYKELLIKSGVKVIIVTKDAIPDLPAGWQQVMEAFLTEETLDRAVPDAYKRNAYVSGPPPFVMAFKKHLKQLNVRRIKTDYFVGY